MTLALALSTALPARAEPADGAAAAAAATVGVRADEPQSPDERFADEPTVEELQAAALREARLEGGQAATWPKRARLAPLVPELRVRVGHSTRLQPASGSPDLGGVPELEQRIGWSVDASASWSFDRAIFNRDEIQAVREVRDLAARRTALVAEVTRLVFQRRRLALELAQHPPPKPGARLEMRLRIEELGALLDGLTGGALSRRAPRQRSSATPGGGVMMDNGKDRGMAAGDRASRAEERP